MVVFILTIASLTVLVAIASRRRNMTSLEVAAVTGGFILVATTLVVLGDEDLGGAMVGLAAFGGGLVQWGFDTYRTRVRPTRRI